MSDFRPGPRKAQGKIRDLVSSSEEMLGHRKSWEPTSPPEMQEKRCTQEKNAVIRYSMLNCLKLEGRGSFLFRQ